MSAPTEDDPRRGVVRQYTAEQLQRLEQSRMATVWFVWSKVLRLIQETGRHPSPTDLADLIDNYRPLPGPALDYVAKIVREGRPPGPPARIIAINSMAPTERELRWTWGGLTPRQYFAVRWVRRRHRVYAAFETQSEPRSQNIYPNGLLVHVASRGVWRVRGPKQVARETVGPRLGVSPSTLEKWERKLGVLHMHITEDTLLFMERTAIRTACALGPDRWSPGAQFPW